ncbi:MAG: hypothetical protein ACEQSF_02065 [Solirubrobacteraceae bacterium]
MKNKISLFFMSLLFIFTTISCNSDSEYLDPKINNIETNVSSGTAKGGLMSLATMGVIHNLRQGPTLKKYLPPKDEVVPLRPTYPILSPHQRDTQMSFNLLNDDETPNLISVATYNSETHLNQTFSYQTQVFLVHPGDDGVHFGMPVTTHEVELTATDNIDDIYDPLVNDGELVNFHNAIDALGYTSMIVRVRRTERGASRFPSFDIRGGDGTASEYVDITVNFNGGEDDLTDGSNRRLKDDPKKVNISCAKNVIVLPHNGYSSFGVKFESEKKNTKVKTFIAVYYKYNNSIILGNFYAKISLAKGLVDYRIKLATLKDFTVNGNLYKLYGIKTGVFEGKSYDGIVNNIVKY